MRADIVPPLAANMDAAFKKSGAQSVVPMTMIFAS